MATKSIASKRKTVLFITVTALALTTGIVLIPQRFIPIESLATTKRLVTHGTFPTTLAVLLWSVAIFITIQNVLRTIRDAQSKNSTTISPLQRRRRRALLVATTAVAFILAYFLIPTQWLRYLRFKVYNEVFLTPVDEFLREGTISPQLLTLLFIATAAIITFCICRRKRRLHSFLMVASCACCGTLRANEPTSYTPVQKQEEEKRIILVEEASPTTIEPNEIAKTSSTPNPDGGYNAHKELINCFAVMKYLYDGGRYENEEIFYRMRFPTHVEADKKYPLIVWLHGYMEYGEENTRQLAHLHRALPIFVGEDALDFYMIALQNPPDNPEWTSSISQRGNGDSRVAILREIVDRTLVEFPVDPNRVSVMGVSSGAKAAWSYVANSPIKISTLTLFSSAPDPSLTPQTFKDVAIWAFNNRQDGDDMFQRTVDFINRINALGGDARMTVGGGASHDSWSVPLAEGEVFRWATNPFHSISIKENAIPETTYSWRVFLMFLAPTWIILINLLVGAMRDRHE